MRNCNLSLHHIERVEVHEHTANPDSEFKGELRWLELRCYDDRGVEFSVVCFGKADVPAPLLDVQRSVSRVKTRAPF